MSIEIQPETERLVRKEIQNGHFATVDEIILAGVRARQEQRSYTPAGSEARREAIARLLAYAKEHAVSLNGISIKDLIHEGHRV
jgi:Arc/MetJ-type ribon-helix-helix transcriptional regulator